MWFVFVDSKLRKNHKKTNPAIAGFEQFCMTRKDRDSNPGAALGGHALSRRASSATRASFLEGCKDSNYFLFVIFLLFGACKFFFHRIHAVCNRLLEAVGVAFDDEVLTGNVYLNLGLFVFGLVEQ